MRECVEEVRELISDRGGAGERRREPFWRGRLGEDRKSSVVGENGGGRGEEWGCWRWGGNCICGRGGRSTLGGCCLEGSGCCFRGEMEFGCEYIGREKLMGRLFNKGDSIGFAGSGTSWSLRWNADGSASGLRRCCSLRCGDSFSGGEDLELPVLAPSDAMEPFEETESCEV